MTRFAGIEAVLFDLDGTLIDSAPDLGAAADQMRTDRGLPPLPLERYRPMAGAGARGMIGVAFGLTPEDPGYNELRDEFLANYERCMTVRTYAFAGVVELIAELLQRDLVWGVVTNKIERFTLPLTGAMPLFASAGVIVAGDTTPIPSRTRPPCSKPRAAWSWSRSAASTWATMNATSWRGWRPAWARWPRPTATWAASAMWPAGARTPRSTIPSNCCNC